MTPATLAPPPRTETFAADTVAGPPPHIPVRPPFQRTPRRERTGRVTRDALLASVALHLLLALAFLLAPLHRGSPERPDDTGRTLERVEYLDVSEWPETAGGGAAQPSAAPAGAPAENAVTAAGVDSALARLPAQPRFPDRVPDRLPPGGPAVGAGPRVAPGAPGAGGAGSGAIGNNPAGGRLGPGYGDRRLIVRPEAVPERELTEHERYMRDLAGRIGEYNDSIADEAERQRRARNWTVRDRDGREWGIGEGGVPIIAGRRIPVPIAPPIPRDRDTENRERAQARQREEIQRQADDVDRDRNFRERARAIRERRDAERRRQREGAERPDSARSN